MRKNITIAGMSFNPTPKDPLLEAIFYNFCNSKEINKKMREDVKKLKTNQNK